VTSIIIDTGPIVAFLNRRERHHAWIVKIMDTLEPPLFTCDSVLSEACFLLKDEHGGADAVLELVARGLIRSDFRTTAEVARVRELMKKFANVPMSLADACLVRMSELETDCRVLTLDSDFKVYRRNRRQLIPTLMPSS